MHLRRTITLGLTVAGLCALSTAASPASAQALLYTLSGVTFSDGASASGSFVLNPDGNYFGAFDITTTNGLTDTLAGYEYKPGTANPGFPAVFTFATGDPYHSPGGGQYLLLQTAGSLFPGEVTPGRYALQPGALSSGEYTGGSVEFTSTVGSPAFSPTSVRAISGGSLIVTNDSPVPEASTTVSFGLLLALGLGGAAVARKKKAAA